MDLRLLKLQPALLDSAMRDLRYACRSFLRAPLGALTVVTPGGRGLGLVAVVFTILNGFVFHADDVRNPYELFAVERQPSANAAPQGFTRSEYEALVRRSERPGLRIRVSPHRSIIERSRSSGKLRSSESRQRSDASLSFSDVHSSVTSCAASGERSRRK